MDSSDIASFAGALERPPGMSHRFHRHPVVVIVIGGLGLLGIFAVLTTACLHWPLETLRPMDHLLNANLASPQFVKLPAGVCGDEWQPVDSKEACEQAARALDLPATRAAHTVFNQWPTGCYLVRNITADQLWINDAPGDMLPRSSSHGSNRSSGISQEIEGWVPEPICKRTPAPSSDSSLEGTANPFSLTPNKEKGVILCRFVVGAATSPSCPTGSVPLNSSECRAMPYYFGGRLHAPFEESSPMDPPGCFFFGSQYYFNNHPTGAVADGRNLYCKHCTDMPKVHTGDWSEWGGDSDKTLAANAQENARFRKISMGKCSDSAMHPIRSKAACEEASRYLKLSDSIATVNTIPERPEGCYYFRNYKDGSETLWLSISPLSHGNGAETSNLADGCLRQPICSKEPLAGTAAEGPGTSALLPSPRSVPYRKISSGHCMDIGMEPIMGDSAACEDAARTLGLVDVVAKSVSMPTHPEGCYYFWNKGDLTSTLWFNTSPQAKGNGAQVETGANHGVRQPLCRK